MCAHARMCYETLKLLIKSVDKNELIEDFIHKHFPPRDCQFHEFFQSSGVCFVIF